MNEILGQKPVEELVEIAARDDIPVLLVGDTGCGKTSIVRNLAQRHGKTFSRFNLTGETTVDEFVGKFILKNEETVWQDGLLVTAMKEGHYLVVDEVNVALPEILFVLHSLLDDDKFVVISGDKGEIVRPHKDFRFFGTMNPVDEYAGTKDLNKAFKSRFGMIINMSYPDSRTEVRIIKSRTGVDDMTASLIVDFAVRARDAKKGGEIFYTCSTRDLIQWGELSRKIGLERAMEVTVLGKAEGDTDKLRDIFKSVGGKYVIEKMIERLKKAKSGNNLLNVHDRMAKQLKEIKDEPI